MGGRLHESMDMAGVSWSARSSIVSEAGVTASFEFALSEEGVLSTMASPGVWAVVVSTGQWAAVDVPLDVELAAAGMPNAQEATVMAMHKREGI